MTSSLLLIPPPSRETWEMIVYGFQFFPVFTAIQWLVDYHPMGKRSVDSKFNIPGKWAWFLMEIPGFITLLYCMVSIPPSINLTKPLPWANWTMGGMFTIHYIYRAILSPLWLNPSMSPIHPIVFASAFAFQVVNGISLGGWLGGYGPTTNFDWQYRLGTIELGMVLWGWSFLLTIFHDDDLREIRRSALRRQKAQAEKDGKPIEGVEKLYMIPKNGLFHFIFYPHFLCEWCEWGAFWIVGGLNCVPARNFLFAEIASMLPQAIAGKKWYVQKFGKERVGKRKAIIPGIL